VRSHAAAPALHVPLEPELPAESALRRILLHLLEAIRANARATLEDLDPEPVHDLRVAVRRTRAALAQLKGVLPATEIAVFRPDLKWLARASGPCRDLDVLWLAVDAHCIAADDDVAEALEPLERRLLEQRREARQRLESALDSDRFQRFLLGWQSYLVAITAPEARPSKALLPVLELANRRILRAFERVVAQGDELGDAPPNDALHRLRIEAKKLRYLLELFRTLYPPPRVEPRIDELKLLQDVLGGVQDAVFHLRHLSEMSLELGQAGASPTTLVAVADLAAAIQARQDELRGSFRNRFAVLAGPTSRAQYRELTAV